MLKSYLGIFSFVKVCRHNYFYTILVLSFIFSFLMLVSESVQADARSEINAKYQSLGGAKGFLGKAKTGLGLTPDGIGRYVHYKKGSIYWTPSTGAHEIHGAIREKWKSLGWEKSALGYPISDELMAPDRKGRFSRFQSGAIYWHPSTGAHVIKGAIRKKWGQLSWERGVLGYPTTDERRTPDGIGLYNHFTGSINPYSGMPSDVAGSIYYTPQTGAHWLMGRIRDTWKEGGWEKSPLGYPTTDQFSSEGFLANNFEGGQIKYKQGKGLSVLTQNMGFLVAPASYGGEDISKAFWALIRNIRELNPDVIALQEMFIDSRSERLGKELRDLYPYWLHGPDENDIESDGGLMILSRYPMVTRDQIIFRDCGAEDCFANKGVLHARIKTPFNEYDIFNTHTQNPDPDLGGKQGGVVQRQLNALYSFVEAKRGIKQRPAIIVGDLNTNGENKSLYNDMMWRLGNPLDAWKVLHPNKKGITSDNVANFKPGARKPRPQDRGKNGERLDYIFYHNSARYTPLLSQTEVIMWETETGKDLSDHYGLYSWFGQMEEKDVIYSGNISKVEVKFTSFHCLEVTDGTFKTGDPDEVEWTLGLSVDGGTAVSTKTSRINGIDGGEIFNINGKTLHTRQVNKFINITLEGQEIDDFCIIDCFVTGKASLGRKQITIAKEQLYEALVSPQRYAFNVMRGDGAEYIAYVEVKAFK